MIGRVGPAFDHSSKKKCRIKFASGFPGAELTQCYVWVEDINSYAPVEAVVPLIEGEFVDAVRVEMTGGIRYFIARQMDELIGTLNENVWLDHLANETKFWFEEI